MGCVLLISLAVSLLLGWAEASLLLAGEARPALSNARQEAESKGYAFISTHEEIVSRAKKEGCAR